MIRTIAVLATVLTLALAGIGAAAGSGVYSGVTSERSLIHLTVRDNRVVHVHFVVTFFGTHCAFTGASAKTSAPIRRGPACKTGKTTYQATR